jgi:undecaprenyl diphosphate synthase
MNPAFIDDTTSHFDDVIYSPEDLQKIDPARIPQHIAIIMDGNRRWAKQQQLNRMIGHWKGAEVIINIVKAAHELGIKVLTVYAFSTENWMRTQKEIEDLMHLLKEYLVQKRETMLSNGVKLDIIGDVSRLPKDVRQTIDETKAITAHCDKIELVLALNYGGRDDIRRAAILLAEECLKGKFSPQEISEQMFAEALDTAKWKDPELLIRTGGEQRLSNFLLWQVSYSEVYITPVLWPDFDEQELLTAVLEYQQRDRRWGAE